MFSLNSSVNDLSVKAIKNTSYAQDELGILVILLPYSNYNTIINLIIIIYYKQSFVYLYIF